MNPSKPDSPVAILGYSYRMPGDIRSDDDFWRLLSNREIVQEPITERFGRGYRPIGGFSGPGRFASPYEGLIREDGEKLFDRALFGMSHSEMLSTDPQVRMLLSCAWETCERVGWDLRSLHNSPTGVFIGAQVPSAANWRQMRGATEFSVTSISVAMLANRISYHFNLIGPSIACCTACSASMTAMHTALNALRCGDCEQALVGSVNYLGTARLSAAFNALGVISPDGKCHSFDADANGYLRSEGAFVFAIKPLAAAERDGDPIHAVVEATAVNAAGAADGSDGLAPGRYITAPSRHAQVELMRTASARAGRTPQEFDYVEAHATGTVVGDRIEGNAIGEALGGGERDAPLRVAGVKSNVGHMEAAAFTCALLKVVLMMQRRTFAPVSKNHVTPNPEIDFEAHGMQVQTECEPFPDHPVVVGINSFGFGGSNGHCVVREYRPEQPRIWSMPLAPEAGYLIPLSARTTSALVESARRLRQTLDEQPVDLHTLAGNLSRRRTHFTVRAAFAVHDAEQLKEALDAFVESPQPVATVDEGRRRLLMVFTGQGTQWAGCGRALYHAHPVFRRAVDAIEEHWREHADTSLRMAAFEAPQAELNECRLAQPVTFLLQCALVELFKTWGVYPDCVVGHSSGEVAAAYASGALSLAEATRLVYHRATLQQRTAGSGRMLPIGLDLAGVERLLEELKVPFRSRNGVAPTVDIACENAPASTVICGTEEALRPVMEELARRTREHRLLPGNIAFHSAAMDPLQEDAFDALSFLNDRAFDAAVPFVSSVTGLHTERLDSAYWWTNIRRRVRFAAALATAVRDFRPDVVLELAPHSALQSSIAQCLEADGARAVCLPTLRRDTDVCLGFHEALGALFRAGVALDFTAQYPRPEPIAHLLPGYPRDEQTTIDEMSDDEVFLQLGEYSHGPLIGHRVPCDHLLFEARLSEKDFPWLADHRVHHAPIMPAAGYIELMLEALGGGPVHFETMEFLKPCHVPQTAVRLQTELHATDDGLGEYTFTVSSRPYEPDSESDLHCRGTMRRVGADHPVSVPRRLAEIDLTRFKHHHSIVGESGFYERLEACLSESFQYGPYFRTVRQIRYDTATRDYLVDLEMDEELWMTGRDEGLVSGVPLLDGGLQIFLYHLMFATDLFAVPQRAVGVTFVRPPSGPRLICHVTKPAEGWMDVNQRGQFCVRAGERAGGSLSFYDAATEDLVARIDHYSYFNSNPRWKDLPRSKHTISWQPKFVPPAAPLVQGLPDGEIEPAVLLAALEQFGSRDRYALHVVEIAHRREPDQTILKRCADHLSRDEVLSEFWLMGEDRERTRAHYDAFHRLDAAVRFECLDLAARPLPELTEGLLRPGAAELVFLHGDAADYGAMEWSLLRRLAVDGGLVLVCHEASAGIAPDAGWSTLRAGRRTTLLQAAHADAGAPDGGTTHSVPVTTAPRWVIGEPQSCAAQWIDLLGASEAHWIPYAKLLARDTPDLATWPRAASLQAIDFFCGDDPDDPTGERGVATLVALLRALVPLRIEHRGCRCRFTVVTRRAAFEVDNPRAHSLWGAVRGLAVEADPRAELDFRLVDLGEDDDLPTLARLDRSALRERELAVRDNRIWAPRLISIRERAPMVPAGEDPPYRLCLDNPGQIDGLQMKTFQPASLGAHDVEIDVVAAGLNFRDVMVTLGLLPALSYERSALGREVGTEASGIVRRVGEHVRTCRVGDEVAFIQGGCIANRMVVDQHLAFVKPQLLSMGEAASVLSVYVTAYCSLVHVAHLRRGQRVLIHAGMGGVGQAAIALAKHVGAEIYATAGSASKREQLRALGVRAAFDSHHFDWYDELMAATDGEGVDVVLNSLAGRHIILSLEALRPGGWHCEIGKMDIYADRALRLRVFRKNLRFAAIDVDRLIRDTPELARELSQACLGLLEQGAVPPLPTTCFDYGDCADALRLMSLGKHQGKLVLETPTTASDRTFPVADVRPFLDPDATYLVTGALGGFGLKLLPYLAVSGARHLTLMDRDAQRRRSVEWIRNRSALGYLPELHIDIVAGDVAEETDVRRCVDGLQRPLKGVFHLAGTLDDCLLAELSTESLAKVFAPKARGALNLHLATVDAPLDHFVLCSSLASTFGNPGQINYGAASAFLDGLAAFRRRRSLPALSYNLAAVSEAGMASRNLHVLRIMRAAGMPPISADFAIANLDYAMRVPGDRDHLVTALFSRPPWTFDSPEYLRSGRMLGNAHAFAVDAGSRLTLETVVAQIAAKVAELCGHDEGNPGEPLSSFGLTSISVAELGAFIQMQFDYQASALELMTTASCLSLAEAIMHSDGAALVTDRVQATHPPEAPAGAGASGPVR